MPKILSVLFFIILTIPSAYAGDSDKKEEGVVYKQKTEIDFEELEVEGTLQKPQSALVLERKKASFNPMINLRMDWNQEIDESIDEIK